jgi:hypothetical protein
MALRKNVILRAWEFIGMRRAMFGCWVAGWLEAVTKPAELAADRAARRASVGYPRAA